MTAQPKSDVFKSFVFSRSWRSPVIFDNSLIGMIVHRINVLVHIIAIYTTEL